jgi:Phospholipase_D-nuclease N-terminal
MLRVVAVLVVVGVMVYAFVDCLRSDGRDVRGLPRPAWLLLILVPLVGAIAYLVAGRPLHEPEEPPARPFAPDDDPEFLRRLDLERRRRQADEERRRRQRERREEGPRDKSGPEGEDQAGHPA